MKLFWNMGQCLNEANTGEESKDGVLGLMPGGKTERTKAKREGMREGTGRLFEST